MNHGLDRPFAVVRFADDDRVPVRIDAVPDRKRTPCMEPKEAASSKARQYAI